MTAHAQSHPTPCHAAQSEQAVTLFCRRCLPRRTLAIVSPGRLWWRVRGQTILVTGGRATVWCPSCGAQHEVDLTPPA